MMNKTCRIFLSALLSLCVALLATNTWAPCGPSKGLPSWLEGWCKSRLLLNRSNQLFIKVGG